MGCLFNKPKASVSTPNDQLRDLGTLEYPDFSAFLKSSKEEFDKKWMHPHHKHSETIESFQEVAVLGGGTFGVVILVKHKAKGEYYAMKSMDKEKIMRMGALERVREEKNILQNLNFTFTVRLNYSFVTNSHVHLVMPFVPGGELYRRLQKQKKFDEQAARFYASQLLLALEYLHYLHVIYRDLKLENVLIDRAGYLKVVDFGLSKRMTTSKTYTVCGTLEYMCPEMIRQKGYGFPADWWAFGILVYELVVGNPPFRGRNDLEITDKIMKNQWSTPCRLSRDLRDLLKNMLNRDLHKRLGGHRRCVEEIKGHKWFADVDWCRVLNRGVTPPFVPVCDKEGDTDNFSVNSDLWESPWEILRKTSVNEYQSRFKNF